MDRVPLVSMLSARSPVSQFPAAVADAAGLGADHHGLVVRLRERVHQLHVEVAHEHAPDRLWHGNMVQKELVQEAQVAELSVTSVITPWRQCSLTSGNERERKEHTLICR